MAAILSLSDGALGVWASGLEGLFLMKTGQLEIVPQPQTQLYCSAAVGETILVGGRPYGLALSINNGANWHPVDTDNVHDPALCITPDPQFAHSGVLLAGTEGAGVLRSRNGGWNWTPCNYGLESFTIFQIAWASLAPKDFWPAWEVVFAAAEDGLYRSPNGGLGWRRCGGAHGAFLAIAAADDFHHSGVVLAGAEENGLWRSSDGGRHFDPVRGTPEQINALVETPQGWLLSGEDSLWSSPDGIVWQHVPDSPNALVMLTSPHGLYLGNEEGIKRVEFESLWSAITASPGKKT